MHDGNAKSIFQTNGYGSSTEDPKDTRVLREEAMKKLPKSLTEVFCVECGYYVVPVRDKFTPTDGIHEYRSVCCPGIFHIIYSERRKGHE